MRRVRSSGTIKQVYLNAQRLDVEEQEDHDDPHGDQEDVLPRQEEPNLIQRRQRKDKGTEQVSSDAESNLGRTTRDDSLPQYQSI